jgi:hypothetical protein
MRRINALFWFTTHIKRESCQFVSVHYLDKIERELCPKCRIGQLTAKMVDIGDQNVTQAELRFKDSIPNYTNLLIDCL